MGYEMMSAPGRVICEFMELSARHDVLKWREKYAIPEYVVSKQFIDDLRERYKKLGEAEKAAVATLRVGMSGPHNPRTRWRQWLEQHLTVHPSDATELFLMESTFAGGLDNQPPHIRERCGIHDYPWRMEHQD